MRHTQGAIKAAEIITQGTYGERKRYHTAYGTKTVEGIADIIDRYASKPKLTEACILAIGYLRAGKLSNEMGLRVKVDQVLALFNDVLPDSIK